MILIPRWRQYVPCLTHLRRSKFVSVHHPPFDNAGCRFLVLGRIFLRRKGLHRLGFPGPDQQHMRGDWETTCPGLGSRHVFASTCRPPLLLTQMYVLDRHWRVAALQDNGLTGTIRLGDWCCPILLLVNLWFWHWSTKHGQLLTVVLGLQPVRRSPR